jgi:hypothetical protein
MQANNKKGCCPGEVADRGNRQAPYIRKNVFGTGRASPPPGPSDHHLPEELLRHNDTSPHDCLEYGIDCPISFLTFANPSAQSLAVSVQELSIASAASPDGLASVLYVLPFKPAILM